MDKKQEQQQEKAQPQLAPDNLKQFDYNSTRHDAVVPQGVSLDDLLVPAFWAHHAIKLRPWDEVRARAEDGTWVASLLVLDTSRTWAKVHLLAFHPLTTGDVSLTQASEAEVKAFVGKHRVTFRGAHKWSVVRIADSSVLEEGRATKEEAVSWLEAHARTQVGAPVRTAAPAAVAA